MQMSATREKHVFAKTWKWISSLDCKNWVTSCHSPDCALRRWKVPAIATRFRGVRYRNRWYHQPACLQNALATQLDRFLLPTQQFAHKTHRLPFGLLLIKRGAISSEQLRDALQRQRHAGYGNLSVWLRQAVDLQESEIAATLAQQCGCPLFPLQRGAAATFLADSSADIPSFWRQTRFPCIAPQTAAGCSSRFPSAWITPCCMRSMKCSIAARLPAWLPVRR